MHRNIPELLVSFVWYFSTLSYFLDYYSYHIYYNCQEKIIFAHEGLNISYKCIKSIQRCIKNQLCSKYLAKDILCPPKLQMRLFTSAAIDNIDHNESSIIATTSFHWTSITIFQHTDHPVQNVPIQYDMNNSTTKTKLPSYFPQGGKPEPRGIVLR